MSELIRSAGACLLGMLVALSMVTVSDSVVLFGTDSSCDCLYIIDLGTGDTTHIGELGPTFTTPTSMAADLNGKLYTVNNSTDELLTINKVTGAATVIGSGTGQIGGLAIAPVDVPGPNGITLPPGTLFGSVGGASNLLVTIDKTTADTAVIGSIGLHTSGLAFRGDGVLFGAELSFGTDLLYTISTETGARTNIGVISPNIDRIGALVFDPNGTLYGSDINSDSSKIFTIDQDSATVSNVLPVEVLAQGLAFSSPIDCLVFDDLDNTLQLAEIDNKGIRNSFQVKANNARKKYDQGKPKTAGNVLCALLHHLRAQEGKHVSRASALDIRDCVITLAWNLEIPLRCLSDTTESLSTLPRNYPNPFNVTTTIEYDVGSSDPGSRLLSGFEGSRVVLKVYDMTGREVRTLVDGDQEAGYYMVEWDGRTDSGREAASGIYFYQLRIDNGSRTRKMVLMR